MDITTFYAVVSASCFALVGLWWNVVQGYPGWVTDPARRRAVGGVYLTFLLPAAMGLVAQVGGSRDPEVWRSGFVVAAAVGCWSSGRLLSATPGGRGAQPRTTYAASLVLFLLLGLVALAPEAAVWVTGLRPLQTAGLLLSLLVLAGHGLVWSFMVGARVRTRTRRLTASVTSRGDRTIATSTSGGPRGRRGWRPSRPGSRPCRRRR